MDQVIDLVKTDPDFDALFKIYNGKILVVIMKSIYYIQNCK